MQRGDKRKYHYIYKVTRDDGKYYIGMHSTNELEDGYFGSGKLITRSKKNSSVNILLMDIHEEENKRRAPIMVLERFAKPSGL